MTEYYMDAKSNIYNSPLMLDHHRTRHLLLGPAKKLPSDLPVFVAAESHSEYLAVQKLLLPGRAVAPERNLPRHHRGRHTGYSART